MAQFCFWALLTATAFAATGPFRDVPTFELAMVALAYGAAILGYRPDGLIRGWNCLGDYSYGVYIWGFPVQLAVVRFPVPVSPTENILMALPVVILLAVLSWHLVEGPALATKDRLVRRFKAEGAIPTLSPPRQPSRSGPTRR